jgi:hypothetical protein
MSVKLKTPSNGSVTLSPEDTGSDVVLTVPAVAGEILNDQSDIETQVKSATNATGSAPIFACRAWVNFDGSTTPPTIRGSGNVSSVTRNATGDYTVNFATAMPDANYSTNATTGQDNTANSSWAGATVLAAMTAPTTSGVRVGSWFAFNGSNRTAVNSAWVFVAIFR